MIFRHTFQLKKIRCRRSHPNYNNKNLRHVVGSLGEIIVVTRECLFIFFAIHRLLQKSRQFVYVVISLFLEFNTTFYRSISPNTSIKVFMDSNTGIHVWFVVYALFIARPKCKSSYGKYAGQTKH